MTRDSFDRFQPRERGLFGDNEHGRSRDNEVERTRLTDVTLVLRQDRPLSIMVSQGDGANEKWIPLPKSMIEYRKISATVVEVTLPEVMAKEKGLI